MLRRQIFMSLSGSINPYTHNTGGIFLQGTYRSLWSEGRDDFPFPGNLPWAKVRPFPEPGRFIPDPRAGEENPFEKSSGGREDAQRAFQVNQVIQELLQPV